MRIYVLTVLKDSQWSNGHSEYLPHSYWTTRRAAERMKEALKCMYHECQQIESIDVQDEAYIDKYITC